MPIRPDCRWGRLVMPTRFKAGFTIVELLVVISIIGVLMTLLLPSVQNARDLTYMIKCRANLRGIANGFYMYAHDNLNVYPPGEMTWYQELNAYLPQPNDGVYPYYSKIYDCPAAKSGGTGSNGYVKGFPSYSVQAQNYGRYWNGSVWGGVIAKIESSGLTRIRAVNATTGWFDGLDTDKGEYGGTTAKDQIAYPTSPMLVESGGYGGGPANIYGSNIQVYRHSNLKMNYLSANLSVVTADFSVVPSASMTFRLGGSDGGQVWARMVGGTAIVENGRTYGQLADWPYAGLTVASPGLTSSY